MEKGTPTWALELATYQDRQRVTSAYRNRSWKITWPDRKLLRAWAKQQGWPAPGFIFDGSFISKMLASDENFALALRESGIQVHIPLEHYTISDKQLAELDALYKERKDMGALGLRPVGWDALVEELREIRRAIAVGVIIEIDGRKKGKIDIVRQFGCLRSFALEKKF